jgi:hypothetical protein
MFATFSQSPTATVGLTAYDLEGSRKRRRAPYPSNLRLGNVRIQALRRAFRQRAGARKHKDHPMSKSLTEMVALLKKSVDDVVAADPGERDQLLAKSFEEFTEAATAQVEAEVAGALEKAAPAEEHFFPDCGVPGEIGDLLAKFAGRVELLKDADAGQTMSGVVQSYLDQARFCMDMALRHAVNDEVEPLGEDEDPDNLPEGVELILVPNAEYPDDEDAAIAVKSVLPGELAKFATDPASLLQNAVDLGLTMLEQGGIAPEELAKAFEVMDLRKAAPPGADDVAAAAGGNPGAGDPGDATADAGGALPSSPDDSNPIQVLGRMLALCLVQCDHIAQMIDGTDGSPAAGTESDDPGTDDQGQVGDTSTGSDPAQKAAPSGELEKADGGSQLAKMQAENAELRRELDGIGDLVKGLMAQPEPVKGVISNSVAVTKGADSSLAKGEMTDGDLEKALSAMSPEQRAEAKIRAAMMLPAVVLPVN